MLEPNARIETRAAPEKFLARYLAGDEDAFGHLVALYEERLYAFLARLIGDAHLAEDVFQLTFVKVAQKAAVFDGRASFSTWLFRIARNAALDELRRRRARPDATAAGDGDGRLADPSQEQPLDRLTREELNARVRLALAALPDEQREAFLLKEEGDLGFAEIGEILGCGRETAKSRFRLAVGKLRAGLGMEADA